MPELTYEPSAARSAMGHEVKAILTRAKAERREPTEDENRRVRRLQGLMRIEDDRALTEAMNDWSEKNGGVGDFGAGARTGRRGFAGADGSGSWGEAVVKASSDHLGRFKDLAPSGGAPVTVPVDPEPIRESEPLTTMRQLIPSARNTTSMFAFLRQVARVNRAAAVAAGTVKPVSDYDTVRVDDRVRTIAHLSPAIERQTISDAPLLERFVDLELRFGLELEIERLILAGSGVGEEFAGLDNTSGIRVQDWTTDLLTTTRSAITALESDGLAASGWVFHPQDWQRVELSANAQGYTLTQAGEQLPVQRAARRLWGLPVAVSSAQAPGVGWLADWSMTQLHVREEAQLSWSENMVRDGVSDFATNRLAFRCECRMGLAVHRPAACVRLALTAPAP